jgi:hypothetical protein
MSCHPSAVLPLVLVQEWCAAGGSDGSRPATPWLFVCPGPERHDASHLVSCHLEMQPQQLLQLMASRLQQQQQLLWQSQQDQQQQWSSTFSSNGSYSSSANGDVRPALQQSQQQQQQRPASVYAQLLSQLDAVAAAQIEASLTEMSQLSEMAVARVLSAQLPAGSGLFLGNSMPIRDMDMYAGPRATQVPLAAAEVTAATISSSGVAGDGALDSSGSSSSSTSGFSAAGFNSAGSAAGSSLLGAPEISSEMDDEDLLVSGNNVIPIGSMPLGGLISGGFGAAGYSSGSGQQGSAAGSGAGFSAGVWGGVVAEALVGVPVAANRGASGIDGVLSTAAGEAAVHILCIYCPRVCLLLHKLLFIYKVTSYHWRAQHGPR